MVTTRVRGSATARSIVLDHFEMTSVGGRFVLTARGKPISQCKLQERTRQSLPCPASQVHFKVLLFLWFPWTQKNQFDFRLHRNGLPGGSNTTFNLPTFWKRFHLCKTSLNKIDQEPGVLNQNFSVQGGLKLRRRQTPKFVAHMQSCRKHQTGNSGPPNVVLRH